MYWGFSMEKLRGQDSNLRPSGYEPDELPLLYLALISDQAVTPGRREMYTEEVYTRLRTSGFPIFDCITSFYSFYSILINLEIFLLTAD